MFRALRSLASSAQRSSTRTALSSFSSAAARPSNGSVNPFGVGRLNHVAIAVPDLPAASAMYRDVLGADVSEPQDVPLHGVTVVFVNVGNTKIELIHPLGDGSPIANFLAKNPAGGIHHICLEVPDVRAAVAEVTARGARVLDPEPKIGAHGNPVVFLHPKDCNGVLTELEEVTDDKRV